MILTSLIHMSYRVLTTSNNSPIHRTHSMIQYRRSRTTHLAHHRGHRYHHLLLYCRNLIINLEGIYHHLRINSIFHQISGLYQVHHR